MLPRINVVLPDGPEPRRASTTGTAWSELRKSMSTVNEDEDDVTLHKPTTQELLQYELMRMTLEKDYIPRHPEAQQQRPIFLLLLERVDYPIEMPKKFGNDKKVMLATVMLNNVPAQRQSARPTVAIPATRGVPLSE